MLAARSSMTDDSSCRSVNKRSEVSMPSRSCARHEDSPRVNQRLLHHTHRSITKQLVRNRELAITASRGLRQRTPPISAIGRPRYEITHYTRGCGLLARRQRLPTRMSAQGQPQLHLSAHRRCEQRHHAARIPPAASPCALVLHCRQRRVSPPNSIQLHARASECDRATTTCQHAHAPAAGRRMSTPPFAPPRQDRARRA